MVFSTRLVRPAARRHDGGTARRFYCRCRDRAIIAAMDSPATPERPDRLTRLRQLLPVGEGCLMTDAKVTGPVLKTVWALRRTDADIAQFKSHPDRRAEQRAMSCLIKPPATRVNVRLVVLAIRLGLEPDISDLISASFVNEYDPVCHGLLENLTTQAWVPVMLIGDTESMDCIGSIDNTVRSFAQHALGKISSSPPWTRDDFARAVERFKQTYPDKPALWRRTERQ